MGKLNTKALEDDGWIIGDAQDFLGLDDAEAAIVEVRVTLATCIRRRRAGAKLTQAELAKRAGTIQARVAKAEHGHPDISLDLFLRLLFALGSDPAKIARALSR